MLKRFLPDAGLTNESDRDAWVRSALAAIPQGSRILDAGAGTQRYRAWCAHLDYVSQDFAEYDSGRDPAGLHPETFDYGKVDIVSDITAIPEPDASFDAILCAEVLEHLPRPIGAIAEFARLLKPGGRLLLTAPFCSLTHFAPYHFSTGFSRYWYEKHLPDHGFAITALQPSGNYFEYLAQELHRVPQIATRYAGMRVTILDRIALRLGRRMLARFSGRDAGSHELLCYGYHVQAVRQ
jgi:SAM-dependent methyltransferase